MVKTNVRRFQIGCITGNVGLQKLCELIKGSEFQLKNHQPTADIAENRTPEERNHWGHELKVLAFPE